MERVQNRTVETAVQLKFQERVKQEQIADETVPQITAEIAEVVHTIPRAVVEQIVVGAASQITSTHTTGTPTHTEDLPINQPAQNQFRSSGRQTPVLAHPPNHISGRP